MGTSENVEMKGIEEDNLEEITEDFKRIPPWKKQITVRGIVASLFIGIIYSVVAMKLNLTTGLVPNLNVSAALLAFVFIRTWTKFLEKTNFTTTPFTRQENTVIQTCAVACYSISRTYEQAGVDTEGNSPGSYKEISLDWVIGFVFVVSFVGLLALVPLRKIMIIDYKLPYPSGTATAVLINGFHTTKGDKMAKFYFDFSMTYVGAGMICSHIVNLSLLLGAVLSYGVMWPLISEKKGDWFPQNIKESSMKSMNGYKVFISIALILGDGLYNFVKTLLFTFRNMHSAYKKKKNLVAAAQMVLRSNCIHFRASLSFCNAYGSGLTDMNMAYNYGKVALFVLSALAGKDNGVIAGLIGCGLVKSMVSISSDLMHDFKTGHLTLTSPRSMLVSQAIGTAIGCIVGPLTFFLFYKAFEIGDPNGAYKAPYALIYRNMAILGVEGFSALPRHCLQLLNSKKAGLMVPAVASGLICGDGLWILPSCILALAKISPPVCMNFLPGKSS
ncbi:hypothetical protein DH2020_009802 [Rehmannia glutinosa]|uniref:Uncharacterized protein n=1 Tax=Rehmannia glutinosa TaxID=99300 RepID=A0ABR0X9R2_REHGL